MAEDPLAEALEQLPPPMPFKHERHHPVVHLPDRGYNDAAARRDWQKQGFAVTTVFGNHPVCAECPQCSGTPPEEAEPAVLPRRCPHSWPSGPVWAGAVEQCGLGCGATRRHTGDGWRFEYPEDPHG